MSTPAGVGLVVRPGRAVTVILTGTRRAPRMVLRHELDLGDAWVAESLHPYHRELRDAGAEGRRARRRGCTAARHATARAIRRFFRDMRSHGFAPHGVGVVASRRANPAHAVGAHARAHAEERKLYDEAVGAALAACGLRPIAFVDMRLRAVAAMRLAAVDATLRAFSHQVGTPWRAPEKQAALAAWLVLPARLG
jgi:hypothetical protein